MNLVLRYQHNMELNQNVGNFFKNNLGIEYHAVSYNGWNFLETEMIVQNLDVKNLKIKKITKNVKQLNIKHNMLLNSLEISILQDKKNNEESNTFLHGPIKIEIQNYKKEIPEKVLFSIQTTVADKNTGERLLDLGEFSLFFETRGNAISLSLDSLNGAKVLSENVLRDIIKKSDSEIEKKRLAILLAIIKEKNRYSFKMEGEKLNEEMLLFKNLELNLQNSKVLLDSGDISFKLHKLNELNGTFNILNYKNIGNDVLTLSYLFDLQVSLSNFNKGIEKKFKFKGEKLLGYTKFNRSITNFFKESFINREEGGSDENKSDIVIIVKDKQDSGVYINSKHYLEYLDQLIAIYVELMSVSETAERVSAEAK